MEKILEVTVYIVTFCEDGGSKESTIITSNIKLLTNIPIEDKRSRLREANGLSVESFHKKYTYIIILEALMD